MLLPQVQAAFRQPEVARKSSRAAVACARSGEPASAIDHITALAWPRCSDRGSAMRCWRSFTLLPCRHGPQPAEPWIGLAKEGRHRPTSSCRKLMGAAKSPIEDQHSRGQGGNGAATLGLSGSACRHGGRVTEQNVRAQNAFIRLASRMYRSHLSKSRRPGNRGNLASRGRYFEYGESKGQGTGIVRHS